MLPTPAIVKTPDAPLKVMPVPAESVLNAVADKVVPSKVKLELLARVFAAVVYKTVLVPPNVVRPVPPLATGKAPVTPFAKFTCAHAGLLLAPVFAKYLVAVALLFRSAKVSAPEA